MSTLRYLLRTNSLFSKRTFILGVSLLALGPLGADRASTGSEQTLSSQIFTIIQKARTDAEQEIIALHGQSAFSLLKQKIATAYPPQKIPAGKANDPCPALGFNAEDKGPVIYGKVLNQAGGYYLTGMEALLEGHPEMAKWCFAMAASNEITCPVYLSNLAFVLNEGGDFTDAASLLEYAKKLDPSDSSIYINLAFSYQHLKKYDEAIQALLFAISLHPTFTRYQDMLLELQKMRKAEHLTDPFIPVVKKGDEQPKSVQLGNALKLLEEKKDRDFDEELSSGFKPSPSSGGGPQKPAYRAQRSRRTGRPRLNPKVYGDNQSECGWLSQQAYVLERAGDEAVQSAGLMPKGGNPVDKFISAGHDFKDIATKAKNVEDVAMAGSLTMAMVFYGVAGEAYLECEGSDKWEDDWAEVDRRFEEARAEFEKAQHDLLDEMTKKEEFSTPVCTGKICVSRGKQGTIKLEISELLGGSETLELRMHPTNINRFGLKVSQGRQVQVGEGNIASASVGYDHYVDCTFGTGCSRGLEMGGSATLFGRKFSKSIDLMKFSAENTPGTAKTGWQKPSSK